MTSPSPRWIATVALAAAACPAPPDGTPDAGRLAWAPQPALPETSSNNAVAAVARDTGCELYTSTGLDGSRTPAGIHTRTYRWRVGTPAWERVADAPGPPVIAASAVALRGRVHLLGGYDVAATGVETSHAAHRVFDPAAGAWTIAAPLPVPIDDAVAVAWRERWIIVVSGWASTAPSAAVQIYDADSDRWAAAPPFPGAAVFGHAGALVGDELVVIDGVASRAGRFELVNQTWRAHLDPAHPLTIAWTDLGAHEGVARYRAAGGAVGRAAIFQGGTAEPYNFDGLTYAAGTPATPRADALVIGVDLAAPQLVLPPRPVASMDHRALAACGAMVFTIGGLEDGPATTADVWALAP